MSLRGSLSLLQGFEQTAQDGRSVLITRFRGDGDAVMMHTRAYKEVCRDEDWTIFRLAPSGLRGWPGYRWAQPRPQYHRRASASNSVFFQNRGVGVVWKERMLAFLRKKREREERIGFLRSRFGHWGMTSDVTVCCSPLTIDSA